MAPTKKSVLNAFVEAIHDADGQIEQSLTIATDLIRDHKGYGLTGEALVMVVDIATKLERAYDVLHREGV